MLLLTPIGRKSLGSHCAHQILPDLYNNCCYDVPTRVVPKVNICGVSQVCVNVAYTLWGWARECLHGTPDHEHVQCHSATKPKKHWIIRFDPLTAIKYQCVTLHSVCSSVHPEPYGHVSVAFPPPWLHSWMPATLIMSATDLLKISPAHTSVHVTKPEKHWNIAIGPHIALWYQCVTDHECCSQ